MSHPLPPHLLRRAQVDLDLALRMDFAGGDGYPSALLTHTRASAGTHWNAASTLLTPGVDVARFQHDPATGAPQGLLNEAAATNLMLRSNLLSNAAWTKRGTATSTDGASADGPDGTADYSRITGIGGLGAHDVFQVNFGVSGSTRYEPSFLVRQISTTGVLRMIDAAGTGSWDIALASLSGDWEHVTRDHAAVTVNAEFTSSAGGAGGILFHRVSGPATLEFDVAYCQYELGTASTSPIETAGSSATRAADAAVVNIADGTYDIDIVRVSGTTSLSGQSVSGGYTIPTDPSPVLRVEFA